MSNTQLAEVVYRIGAIDWNIRNFHGYSMYVGTWTAQDQEQEDNAPGAEGLGFGATNRRPLYNGRRRPFP